MTASLIATANDSKEFVDYFPWAGVLAGIVALAIALWNQTQNRRARRRDLYSDAYKAVVAWEELYYRVCRRDPDRPYELVELFHAAQEAIDYHDGWIRLESEALGRSYRRFVRDVKTSAAPFIKRAWAGPPCKPEDGFSPPEGEEETLKIGPLKRQFLNDVSDHLSLLPWRWGQVRNRYQENES